MLLSGEVVKPVHKHKLPREKRFFRQFCGQQRQRVVGIRKPLGERVAVGAENGAEVGQLGGQPRGAAAEPCGGKLQRVRVDAGGLQRGNGRQRLADEVAVGADAAVFGKLRREPLQHDGHQQIAAAVVDIGARQPAVFPRDAVGQALKVEHLAVHIVAVAQRLAQQPLGFQRLLLGHEDDTVRPVLQRLAQNGEQVGRFPAARAAYDPVQHTRTASFLPAEPFQQLEAEHIPRLIRFQKDINGVLGQRGRL